MTPAGLASTVTVRKDNPLCGDAIVLTVSVTGDLVEGTRQQARACSLTAASARALAELVPGRTVVDARDLAARLERAMRGEVPLPDGLDAVAPALLLPSRRGCVLLPWRALVQAVETV